VHDHGDEVVSISLPSSSTVICEVEVTAVAAAAGLAMETSRARITGIFPFISNLQYHYQYFPYVNYCLPPFGKKEKTPDGNKRANSFQIKKPY
jgi:hypothetical protein